MYPWLSSYWQEWLTSFAEGRLSHAWLLSGPQGIGKQELARQMAAALLCQHSGTSGACGVCHACTLLGHGNHPDLQLLGDPADKSIGVDAIRELIGKLNAGAQLGGAKVVILTRAERMTEAAANALLKTLEEPAGRSHLILLSDQPNRLLPTIRSRCQKLAIRQPDPALLLPWLRMQEGCRDARLQHLRLNQYAPLQTCAYLRDGLDARRQQLCQKLHDFLQAPEQLEPLLKFTLGELPQAFSWLHLLLLDALKLQTGCPLPDCIHADAPGLLQLLAAWPTAHLMAAVERWHALVDSTEGIPSAMPSLHLTHWFNQLILEDNRFAR